ncbi:hypothetical protein [Stenotrophomonas rhizophila]|uniref:hypothetical protein n=1 Tax=Stenotrophomonas rhizophila TaxID=216778 RepID=UPI0033951D4D
MNTDSLLKLSSQHRNSVITLFGLMVLAVLFVHWLSSESLQATWLAFLEFLGAALVSIVLAYFLFVYFVSRGDVELFELQPNKITKEFDSQLATATSWLYKGNFGRYLRGKVLPELERGAGGVRVVACIIDPRDPDVCRMHAGFRERINSIDKGVPYTQDAVAMQVLVTIVMCSWYVSNRNMDISVFLTKTYDPVRIDSNGESMIVTVEDRRSPALRLNKGHFMFSHFTSQIDTAREQGHEVRLRGMRACRMVDIAESDVEAVMVGAGLTDMLGRVAAAEVVKGCREAKNPYET